MYVQFCYGLIFIAKVGELLDKLISGYFLCSYIKNEESLCFNCIMNDVELSQRCAVLKYLFSIYIVKCKKGQTQIHIYTYIS